MDFRCSIEDMSDYVKTNWRGHFSGVLDYVFYCGKSVECLDSYVDVYGMSEEELSRGLPNEKWCSDHVGVVANFLIK